MKKKISHRIYQNSLFKSDIPNNKKQYFSTDNPNPNLNNFVATYSHKGKESGEKPKKEFTSKLEGSRHSPLYNFLGYSSKKPYEAIDAYVKYFSKPGDLILDPFCGSGGVGLISSKQNRHCILIDSSPLATSISKAYCTYANVEELEETFSNLEKPLLELEHELYKTQCHISGKEALVKTTIWSQRYRCIKCFKIVPLKSTKNNKECPNCGENISTRSERLGYIPWGIIYKHPDTKKNIIRSIDGPDSSSKVAFEKLDTPKILNNYWDAEKIGFVDRPLMNHKNPETPWGVLWRPYHGDIRTVSDFFTSRNLYALQSTLNYIEALKTSENLKEVLRLALASIVPSCSKQQRHYPGSTFPNMVMPGVLYTPPIYEEINVVRRFLSKKHSLYRGQKAVNTTLGSGKVLISTQDCRNLSKIAGNSIDYVFTDPPYSGRIQYGELNFIQETILGLSTEWLKNEIIVSETRGFLPTTWQNRLLEAMQEVFRVLKPGSWTSICFHDSNPLSWERLQDVMLVTGFSPGDAAEYSSMETGWKTLKMHTSEDITKRDLVVNYRKPINTSYRGNHYNEDDENKVDINTKVKSLICDILSIKSGITKDQIYDEVISRLVRLKEMKNHSFNTLLDQVAEFIEISDGNKIWFLKENEENLVDAAEIIKEKEAAEIIKSYIQKKITPNPELDGVHYSEIFEYYLSAVSQKPRRLLTEWLLDYFYKTESGLYRLPISAEEEKFKTDGREKGLNRRIKRYIYLLEKGIARTDKERPSDNTLAEWIRHCKRSGLYEHGKFLYEKGDISLNNLSEEIQTRVEEDYQICVRMLARQK